MDNGHFFGSSDLYVESMHSKMLSPLCVLDLCHFGGDARFAGQGMPVLCENGHT